MTKQLFDDAIGEVPPSTVDVEAAIARGRRAALVRRVANPVVATAAAVTVLIGAVAVVLLSSGDANSVGPAVPTTSRITTPPAAPTSSVEPGSGCFEDMDPTAPPGPERPAQVGTRLTHLLAAIVPPRLAPGATLVAHPGAQYPDGHPRGPLEVFHVFSKQQPLSSGGCKEGEDYYVGWSDVQTAAGTGNLSVFLARGGGANTVATECSDNNHIVSCHRQRTTGGDVVVRETSRSESGTTTFKVDVTKADGTVIMLEAEDIAGDSKSGGVPTSTSPPLSMAQLAAIALDPGMTMYPAG